MSHLVDLIKGIRSNDPSELARANSTLEFVFKVVPLTKIPFIESLIEEDENGALHTPKLKDLLNNSEVDIDIPEMVYKSLETCIIKKRSMGDLVSELKSTNSIDDNVLDVIITKLEKLFFQHVL